MTEQSYWRRRGYREGIISAISAGFFFILVGAIFIMTPNLFSRIIAFIDDFAFVQIPNTAIYFFAPRTPVIPHIIVHRAVREFSLVWAIFQIVVLIIRAAARSTLGKIAETGSNIVFWFGATYLIGIFLIERTWLTSSLPLTAWFAFWAAIIVLAGLTMIVRAIILGVGLAVKRTV